MGTLMHCTDTLSTDTTFDIDDTQAPVSDCSKASAEENDELEDDDVNDTD